MLEIVILRNFSPKSCPGGDFDHFYQKRDAFYFALFLGSHAYDHQSLQSHRGASAEQHRLSQTGKFYSLSKGTLHFTFHPIYIIIPHLKIVSRDWLT